MTIYQAKVPQADVYTPDPQDPKPNDALMKIIDAGRQLWCQAYNQFPGAHLPGLVSSIPQGVYESQCPPPYTPPPPAPQPPFSGGQCPDVVYKVNGSYTARNFSLGGCEVPALWYAEVVGPIAGTVVDSDGFIKVQGGSGLIPIRHATAVDTPTPRQILNWPTGACQNTTGTGFGIDATIDSTARKDGQPDTCGDHGASYPDPPDPLPPLSIDVDISSPQSSNSINVPLVYVPFNVEFNVNPYIDVGGVKLEFNVDGPTLTYDDEVTPPPSLPGFNEEPSYYLPEAPIPSSEQFPVVENCCTEVGQILSKVNLVLTGDDYAGRFDSLDTANIDQNTKLDELLDDPIIDVVVPIGQCLTDENGLKYYNEQDAVVSSLESAADRTLQNAIWDAAKVKLDCEEGDPSKTCVAAIPENWQQMLGSTRPRLVQVMRRGATRTYHNYSIPHPANPVQTDVPFLSNFEGGNWLGMIRCSDGARFQVYTRTKSLAQQLVNEAIALIDPAFLDDPPHIRFTELAGSNISTDLRIATKNVYFEDGNKSSFPTWEAKIPGSDLT